MSTESPLVTVLMPVYNGERYLRESIESILNQTFTDFEFLIINDGSTDNSKEIILSYNDPRIRYVENEKNISLNPTLNKGLQLSTSKYIARMDCDDISLPERLEKQVGFMESNPNIGICGTYLKTIGKNQNNKWSLPKNHNGICCELLFTSPIYHPTAMFRNDIIKQFNLYYHPDFFFAEDYELWSRCSEYTYLANLPEILLLYRVHSSGVSKVFKQEYLESANKVRKSILLKIYPTASDEEIDFHLNVVANINYKSDLDLEKVLFWFEKIVQSNAKSEYLDEAALKKILSEKWALICLSNRDNFILFKSLLGSLAGRNSLLPYDLMKKIFSIVYKYFVK